MGQQTGPTPPQKWSTRAPSMISWTLHGWSPTSDPWVSSVLMMAGMGSCQQLQALCGGHLHQTSSHSTCGWRHTFRSTASMNPKHCPWLPLGSGLAAWTDRGLDNEFSAYWLECPVQGGLRSGIGPHTPHHQTQPWRAGDSTGSLQLEPSS